MKLDKIVDFDVSINDDSFVLLCVLRDEILLLEYFIKYYRNLGITHFVFIDNGSEDGSFEYLKGMNSKINMMLFRTFDSYAKNNYGVEWINKILLEYCKNKWCLVVDIDELLLLNNETLKDMRDKMVKSDAFILKTFLLDMYSNDKQEVYKKGDDFLVHSDYYDNFDKTKFSYGRDNKSNLIELCGGVRQRIYNVKCNLNKLSFFKYIFYDDYKLDAGYHRFKKSKSTLDIGKYYYNDIYILQHFKFIKNDLHSFFKKRVDNNQDWNNSKEYKCYLKKSHIYLYDENISNKYVNCVELYDKFNAHLENSKDKAKKVDYDRLIKTMIANQKNKNMSPEKKKKFDNLILLLENQKM
jgi:hypothetical protein